jgi:hypothetical protein
MGAPDPRTGPATAFKGIDIAAGKKFWSFQKLESIPSPPLKDTSWAVSAIDGYILAKLEAKGFKPVGQADRRTLIRRATYDLTGLPPTPEEINAFVNDKGEDPFAKVIDRLLASPAYGERWGRHWLDVVRYADTAGDNSDYPIPQMYKYRNWVIDAFNRDVPYDQFVRLQLAGDLLADKKEPDRQAIIATGYLANARRFGSYEDARYPWHLTIEDTIDNVGRAFLGLTINCSRCHDHKFDPLTNEDYYALYGFFSSTRYPWPGIELDRKQHDLVALPGQGKDTELVYAVIDGKNEPKKRIGQVGNARVQFKGDPDRLGKEVPRRFPLVLGGQSLGAGVKGSGRLELAKWITDPDNPLTARVIVNRIWQYHFGQGIVPTANDFGKQGRRPSHPELLDHLAGQFIKSGWSFKAMHRTIMLSRVYQLANDDDENNLKLDPDNQYHWRYGRRRLDAEAIRDTILAVSGTLDRTPGGAHPFPEQAKWDFTQHKPFKAAYDTNRRSVYLMTQRIYRHPFLGLFDGPDTNASTSERTTTTTPLQALFLMNDPFVHEQSRKFAARLMRERKEDNQRIDLAFALAFGRPPSAEEKTAAAKHLDQVADRLRDAKISIEQQRVRAWESLARVLFMSNEFVYIN